jgi:hypothetical protein
MYRRPKFLELLLEIRQEMAHEADYDVDLFVEMARHGTAVSEGKHLTDTDNGRTVIPPAGRSAREVSKR